MLSLSFVMINIIFRHYCPLVTLITLIGSWMRSGYQLQNRRPGQGAAQRVPSGVVHLSPPQIKNNNILFFFFCLPSCFHVF